MASQTFSNPQNLPVSRNTDLSLTTDVIVIGGGVVGIAAAYELAQKGARVTVVDKGDIGQGCSYGNAGWLTPCFAMPLPMPGMLLKSMKWLVNPDSPLYIKPDPSTLLAKWLVRFLRSMNTPLMHQSVKVLTEISKYSLQQYAKLNEEYPGAFGFDQKGLLMISNQDEGVEAAIGEMNLVAPYGVPGRQMSVQEIKKLEPAITGEIKGGVYFPNEAHAEPLKLVQTLVQAFEKRGGVLHPHTEVFDFNLDGEGQIESLRTTRGNLKAKNYVLATGSWSTAIGEQLGLSIPIMGGKGYSIIVKPLSPSPKIPMMIVEKKIAVTPRAGSVRLAGTLELVDQDFSITQKRVQNIIKGSQMFLNVPAEPEVLELWRGLRPCTPDGVPLIGRPKRYKNLFLCCGHQMLGLQSAAGSGRLLADLVSGNPTLVDPMPFDADRF